jgi:hypothetical protein
LCESCGYRPFYNTINNGMLHFAHAHSAYGGKPKNKNYNLSYGKALNNWGFTQTSNAKNQGLFKHYLNT